MAQLVDSDFNYSHLSASQRLMLAHELLESVLSESLLEPGPLSPEQLAEMHARLADIESGKAVGEPWEVVYSRLLNRHNA